MRRILVAGGLLLAAFTNAKGQWEIQSSHTTANLRGIHNVGNGVVWASGADGTILRTTDNGTQWQICSIPLGAENLDFRGIQGFDRDSAIVMSSGKGDLSRLYKTTDGCQSWRLLLTNPDKEGFWDAIQFQLYTQPQQPPRRTNGVLLGDPVDGKFVIYTTANSGDTWYPWGPAKARRPAVARAGESVFAASNSAVVDGPFAFVTGGSGGSRLFLPQPHSPFDVSLWWAFSIIKLPIPSGPTSGAFSIAFRIPSGKVLADLMIVGGDYSNPNSAKGAAAFVPAREGATLFARRVIVSAHPPNGYRSAVAWDSATNTWIAVGTSGTDISSDDGRNWRALKPSPTGPLDADKNWNALSLPFVVGPQGRIGRLETSFFQQAIH